MCKLKEKFRLAATVLFISIMVQGCTFGSGPDMFLSPENLFPPVTAQEIPSENPGNEGPERVKGNSLVKNDILSAIPEFNGTDFSYILDGEPLFSDKEKEAGAFISLSELDSLGRCGAATMKATRELLPEAERGDISSVRPSGWQSISFEGEEYEGLIDGGMLYNRAHLLAYALSGINAEPRALVTGTRAMNVDGMLPHEMKYLEYVACGGDLLYRVTPIYNGEELLCRGVLLEAWSCGDDSIRERIFCYNVQPGVNISYTDGTATLVSDAKEIAKANREGKGVTTVFGQYDNNKEEDEKKSTGKYALNIHMKKIHRPECQSVQDMSRNNLQYSDSTIEQLEDEGYSRCGNCNPS